jgi:hypothetical protein
MHSALAPSRLLILVAGLFHAAASHSSEPAFCEPTRFADRYEIKPRLNGEAPSRLRVFSIGGVVLAGMAVGNSDSRSVEGHAARYSDAGRNEGSCTWYLADSNQESAQRFNHVPLPTPYWFAGTNGSFARTFDRKLRDEFSRNDVNFVNCARRHGYIGLGCNAQKHRGPSVFAMLLAYAGCSPESAVEIANSLWGSNGVRVGTRLAIARAGAARAAAEPRSSRELRNLFEGR